MRDKLLCNMFNKSPNSVENFCPLENNSIVSQRITTTTGKKAQVEYLGSHGAFDITAISILCYITENFLEKN